MIGTIINWFKKIPGFLVFLLVVISGILATRTLFGSGYFIMHDDLQMMRQLQMEKCFLDGQIPCRWVPDMGYGYGYPLFNYYPPLPYLIGEVFRLFGLAFTSTVKFTFAASIIISGLGMYLFAKRIYGKVGGFIAAVFYMWAPYHAVDVYVRGAMNESWAISIFPFLFMFLYDLLEERGDTVKNTIYLSLAFTALLLSHNLMVLIFTPILFIWGLIVFVPKLNLKRVLNLFTSGILAFCFSAFFTIPVFLEKNLVKINQLTEDYYEYFAHFVSARQLFLSRFWGDGPSVFETADDGMSFSLGHLHWSLSALAIVLVAIVITKNLKSIRKILTDRVIYMTVFFFAIGLFGAFMSHTKSMFIWSKFPTLKFVQFPWRFLTVSIFGMSLAVASIPVLIKRLLNKGFAAKIAGVLIGFVFTATSVVGLVAFSWNYFKPVRSGPVTDAEKFSGEAWRIQQVAGIRDYLPLTAITDPKSQRKEYYEIISGRVDVSEYVQGTNWAKMKVEVGTESAVLKLNILYFPNWRLSIDGKPTETFVPKQEEWGRIWINLPQGRHTVYAELLNTPVRIVSNTISLLAWSGLIIFLVFHRPKKIVVREQ